MSPTAGKVSDRLTRVQRRRTRARVSLACLSSILLAGCGPQTLVAKRLELWISKPVAALEAAWGESKYVDDETMLYVIFSRTYRRAMEERSLPDITDDSDGAEGFDKDIPDFLSFAYRESCFVYFKTRDGTVRSYSYDGKCDPTLIPKPDRSMTAD